MTPPRLSVYEHVHKFCIVSFDHTPFQGKSLPRYGDSLFIKFDDVKLPSGSSFCFGLRTVLIEVS